MMMFRPKKPKPFLIIPTAFFLILSTLLSFSHAQQNDNKDLDLQPDNGIMRRKMEEKDEHHYAVILAEERTKRPDPSDNFKEYKGGWDVTNEHYLYSLLFGSAPFFILAAVWFVFCGLFLCCACICFCWCHRNKPYGYSPLVYACSVTSLIIFTIAAISGCVVMYMGEGKFVDGVNDVTKYVVDTGTGLYDKLLGIVNLLMTAKDLALNQEYMPKELANQISDVKKKIDEVGDLPKVKSQEISGEIKKYLRYVHKVLLVVASLMLVLAFLGFLFSIFGMKTCVYIFIVIGWIIITLTFILCGAFLLFHNAVGDTCEALDQWIRDPDADTALSQIMPCLDKNVGEQFRQSGKDVTETINTLVNGFITAAPNRIPNTKQLGPLVPLVCDPYRNPNADCKGKVPLRNASDEWKKYICNTSESTSQGGVCTKGGRLTPDMYDQMSKAVNISEGLYQSAQFIGDVIDCTVIKETVNNITQNHCPGLKKYSQWVYSGLVTASVTIMLSMFVWLLYVRERRHRKYTKRTDQKYNESPLVGGKKL